MSFNTRAEERNYLNGLRKYLTQAGFTMSERVIECWLDKNPKWEKSGIKCPDFDRLPSSYPREEETD